MTLKASNMKKKKKKKKQREAAILKPVKASNKKKRKAIRIEISPAAELIASNVDILTEILTRLPVKSIIRFKCVSKHWLSLLSDSEFARYHYSRNPRQSISGLYFFIRETLNTVSLHGGRPSLPSLSFLDGLRGQSKLWIAQSCNGLLLCHIYPRGYDYERQYIVCNPATKKSTLLPTPDGLDNDYNAYLAFDPSKSPHHYKVVLVDYHQIHVYSSQSSCWKKVFPDQYCQSPCSAFWNGAIHWLTEDNFLRRFDVDVEEIIAMPNPQSPKILSLRNIMYFGECGGGLILIQSHLRCPRGFRILELERDYSHWVVKCRVNLRPLINEYPKIERIKYKYTYCKGFKVLFAMEGESGRDFALVLAIPGRIVSYNLKYKTWDVLRDLAPGPLIQSGLCLGKAYPFVETLFPV